MEKDAGSLEVGKFADFVILEQNPLKIPVDEIKNITILSTYRGGKVTFTEATEKR